LAIEWTRGAYAPPFVQCGFVLQNGLRLRRKLRRDPGASGIVRTKRRAGDVFALPVERP